MKTVRGILALVLAITMLAAVGCGSTPANTDGTESTGNNTNDNPNGAGSGTRGSSLSELASNWQVGEIMPHFGEYEGKDIAWQVLAVEDGKALIITTNALEARPYNDTLEATTWETSTLRTWLNGEFLSSAFRWSPDILTTQVVNPDNAEHKTAGGNETTDKIFLLSIDEVNTYLSSDSARAADLFSPADGQTPSSWYWWLRSPGTDSNHAAVVSNDGSLIADGLDVHSPGGAVYVRPALWLIL
ncbi:MAG: DUF6273 domain-containing protein [Coriobacteriales bacterium]|jgi:hypothetical protein|nr:DUF6273 domain-containing protein [Coriobacteriales bacterium]